MCHEMLHRLSSGLLQSDLCTFLLIQTIGRQRHPKMFAGGLF